MTAEEQELAARVQYAKALAAQYQASRSSPSPFVAVGVLVAIPVAAALAYFDRTEIATPLFETGQRVTIAIDGRAGQILRTSCTATCGHYVRIPTPSGYETLWMAEFELEKPRN